MKNMERFNVQNDIKHLSSLKKGDKVYLNGVIYTARDQAHKRLVDDIKGAKKLEFDMKGSFLYYTGPTPEKLGKPIGSAGPTTSSRMDMFTPFLFDCGVKAVIGKGKRSPEVVDAIVKNGGVYFCAVGGVGALLAERIVESQIVMYEDLLSEAIRKLVVRDFPVIVCIDSKGNCVY